MKKYFLFSFIVVLLMLPEIARADGYMPFMNYDPFLFFAIIVLEMFVLYLTLGKLLKYQIRLWKIIVAVLLANIVTYILGALIFMLFWGRSLNVLQMESLVFVTSFFVTILVEWLVLLLFFKSVSKKDLFVSSLLMNFVSYMILAYFFIERFLIK
ncbi:MAG: hypothetical protein NTX82_04415 [Candidatus Parcubacteria bacterium]|nr:hypothetical protein [Candidatus Parcubacteria bacterium]